MAGIFRRQVHPITMCWCTSGSILQIVDQTTRSIASTFRRIPPTQRLFHASPLTRYPRNRIRGASALRRKPYPYMLAVGQQELPEPVMDPDLKTELKTSERHPLWAFFNKERTPLPTPMEDHKHGRAWSVDELRRKSWEDLHKLWWVCCKERNLMATQELERKRIQPGYGDKEAYNRESQIKHTQRAIKHALTERYYAWEEALKVAENDPEINLSGKGTAYLPQSFEDDDVFAEQEAAPTESNASAEKTQIPIADPESPREATNPSENTPQHPDVRPGKKVASASEVLSMSVSGSIQKAVDTTKNAVQYPPVRPSKKGDKVFI